MAMPPEEREHEHEREREHAFRHEHEHRTSLSGLTHDEAREFHRYFTLSFIAFLIIAIVAHVLTYIAMPWGIGQWHG